MGLFDRLVGREPGRVGRPDRPATPAERVARGGNGASSFHLWWRFDGGGPVRDRGPFDAVAVTLEVVEAPTSPELRFWALQVDLVDGRGVAVGGAHTGLQQHPSAPGGAANWGGYANAGGELRGTTSALPQVDGPNTVHLPWAVGRPVRLTVDRGAQGWRSTVTDVLAGRSTVLRELHAPGAVALASPVVWTEAFSPCSSAGAVRWSDLAASVGGRWVRPAALVPSYQAPSADGCPDTDSGPDPAVAGAVVQRTATVRRHPADVPIPLG